MRRFKVTVNGARYIVFVAKERDVRHALPDVLVPKVAPRASHLGRRALAAPLPGRILALWVAVGDEVRAGQPLLVLEAMKMENELAAEAPGLVSEVLVGPGDVVALGQELLVFA